MAKRTTRRAMVPEAVRPAFEAVVGLIDGFCRDHLNAEYADLCRRLAEQLARKRPSPLVSGQPKSWACGIVRVVGGANFFHDPSQTPHLKATDIDAGLGVSQATGSAKATAIRKLVPILPMDPDWTLPSRMDANPFVWLLTVNGIPVDVRMAPREFQEYAFEEGLIPYIPADREPR